jgi:hypothetical protein
MLELRRAFVSLAAGLAIFTIGGLALAQDDARTRQLRLLCSLLSGDLTEPGGAAAFRRCMERAPVDAIRENNNIAVEPLDRPMAAPPAGYGCNSRRYLAQGIDRFQADGDLLYVVTPDRKLWRGTTDPKDTKDSRVMDENVAAFQVIGGFVFVQSTGGTLWRARLDGKERTRIDDAVAAFQAIDGGLVYVLGTDARLWREFGDAGKRVEVDRAVKMFHAIDAGRVFVLDAGQVLWREVGTMTSRTHVADQVAGFQYVADRDTTYVRAVDAALWRQSGSDKPQLVDKSVAAFQAVDAHLAYVLGVDGRLWRVPGGRDQAVLVDRNVLAGSGNGAFQVSDPGHVYVLDGDHKLWAESMPVGQ